MTDREFRMKLPVVHPTIKMIISQTMALDLYQIYCPDFIATRTSPKGFEKVAPV